MNDPGTELIVILFVSGILNFVLLAYNFNMSIQIQRLKFQLYQRERWHEKELQKWRERL